MTSTVFGTSNSAALAEHNAKRVVQLERDLAEARTQERQTRDQYQSFRRRVVDVAVDYAKTNNWCGEVFDALDELGLKDLVPNPVKVVRLTLEVDVEGEVGWDEDKYYDEAWDNVTHATVIESELREVDEY